jgi:alkylhydroperoxidase/carboxymuconolactone decarboxylase family protein YurZ
MPEHPLATMQKIDPSFMEHVKAADQLVYGDGALSRKTKLLMAMAFDAAHGAQGGVRSLAQQAMRAGATPAEIAEALRVAYHLAGVGSLYVASMALKEILG